MNKVELIINAGRFEVKDKTTIKKKWETNAAHTMEYVDHIGYGASGCYDTVSRCGYIYSFLEACKVLEKAGYNNLKFNNGGDDDWLVIDHERKEYGFFEDYVPSRDAMNHCETLKELWESH